MYIRGSSRPHEGFTLIELLVVIAIIAILAVVVVLTLQPQALLQQGRDSNRVSDMDTLTHVLSFYQDDQGGSSGYSMGNASSVYVSIPDPTISGATTSTCSSLGLPALPTGYSYQCSSPQDYKNVNGTGWIPVNFTKMSTGVPISSLPTDPTNTSSTGYYYTYYTNGSQYEVTALFESQKYKAQYGQNPMDPDYPEVDAKGSSLSISPLFNPSGLVGYWPLNEGSGTTAYDQSGNGNNGGWQGTASGTNSTYYVAGKVGTYAGYFNGNNDYVITTSSISFGSSGTIIAWIDPAPGSMPPSGYPNFVGYYTTGNEPDVSINEGTGAPYFQYDGGTYYDVSSVPLTSSAWYQVAATYSQSGPTSTFTMYLNGVQTSVGGWSLVIAGGSAPFTIDKWAALPGAINDVRVYTRALSPAEIQALYNAEK